MNNSKGKREREKMQYTAICEQQQREEREKRCSTQQYVNNSKGKREKMQYTAICEQQQREERKDAVHSNM